MAAHEYHRVLVGLEGRCRSIREALDLVERLASQPMIPDVPNTAMPGEDRETRRIPVCERVEDCVTALKPLGAFRRCLSANADCKSYEAEGVEAYPVILVTFETDEAAVVPTAVQVPDVETTRERWLVEPVIPSDVRLRWLDPRSVILDEACEKCERVRFLRTRRNGTPLFPRSHPWLDGRGHVLESSAMADEPERYPDDHVKYHAVLYLPRDEIARIHAASRANATEFAGRGRDVTHAARFPDGAVVHVTCVGRDDAPSDCRATLLVPDESGDLRVAARSEKARAYVGAWRLETERAAYELLVVAHDGAARLEPHENPDDPTWAVDPE